MNMEKNREIIPVRDKGSQSIDELLEIQNYKAPEVNIYETTDEFVLVANLPGVSRNDVRVRVTNNQLIIFGQIDYESNDSRNYILNEIDIANYYRTFRISNVVDQSRIEARFDAGQLQVILPKNEKVKPRTIEIL
jgi:HSP20 family molecular chaperone IbpA